MHLICPKCHKMSVEHGQCLWRDCGWASSQEGTHRFAYSAEFRCPTDNSTDDYVDPVGEIEDAIRHCKRAFAYVFEEMRHSERGHDWFGVAMAIADAEHELQSARRVAYAVGHNER